VALGGIGAAMCGVEGEKRSVGLAAAMRGVAPAYARGAAALAAFALLAAFGDAATAYRCSYWGLARAGVSAAQEGPAMLARCRAVGASFGGVSLTHAPVLVAGLLGGVVVWRALALRSEGLAAIAATARVVGNDQPARTAIAVEASRQIARPAMLA